MTLEHFLARSWPLVVGFCLYISEAIILIRAGDLFQAVTYIGYSIGNIGLAFVAARS